MEVENIQQTIILKCSNKIIILFLLINAKKKYLFFLGIYYALKFL